MFVPEYVCCIKYFTLKQRRYSINSSIKSLAIRDQHYANFIVKIWQNVKTNKTDMYMRWKVCHSDRIAITDRTRGCRVDSPRYGQQYMLFCRPRLFGPDFAPLKGCIYEFAQCIQDKRVVTGEKKFKLILFHKCFHILLIFWKTLYYVPDHTSYRWVESDVHLQRHYRMDIVVLLWVFWA